jgi:repressor LexA
MVQLTEAQRKVLDFIFDHVRDTSMPPTYREICQHLGWNAVGSAQDVVAALRKKGLLVQPERGKARQVVLSTWALDLIQKDKGEVVHDVRAAAPVPQTGLLWVPLLGLVQAGNPNEAIERASDLVPFHFPALGKKNPSNFFALEVDGYSMLNAGFLPGDQLLVERASDARDGDIVVAAPSPGEATVKRFALRGSSLYSRAMESLASVYDRVSPVPPALLVPENPAFSPIPFGERADARILGLVRSLVRPLVQ